MNPELSVNLCGYMLKEENEYLIFRPEGSGDYLFLYFPEQMYIVLDGKEILLDKNACIFFAPHDYQRFRNYAKFINSYVHFSANEEYINGFKIPFSTPFYPKNFEEFNELALEIYLENISTELYAEKLINLAVEKLLILSARHFYPLINGNDKPSDVSVKMQQVRAQMLVRYQYPWTIEELADKMNMSRSKFYSYYHDLFSTSPKAELLAMRMTQAKWYLTNQTMTVKEIAYKCGFNSVEHFERYYKRYYGQSPRGK